MINSAPVSQDTTISTSDITSALDGILTTDKFLASPQMSAFLRYVVEQTLTGNTRRIKAFTVGIEALGKPASFDPQTDPSVRVLAKRLRSSLDTYYLQNSNTTVFIEMKPGSYVPKFLLRSEMPATAPYHQHQPIAGYVAQTPMQADPAQDTENHNPGINSSSAEKQNSAHLSVHQQQSGNTGQTTSDAANSGSRDAQEDRNANINQLWQAYKSSSKVA